jgi:hypothetical protein
LHTEAFRHRSFFAKKLLYTKYFFAHRSYLHTNTFTYRNFVRTQKLFNTEFFLQKKKTQNFLYIIFFNMQKFSNTTPFTQIFLKCKHFCTKKLLNTKTFFAQTLLHTKSFKHKSFFAKKLLHTKHSIFYVQSLLHAIKPHFVRKD